MYRVTLSPKTGDWEKAPQSVDRWLSTVENRFNIYTGAADPVASEVPLGQWVVYRNTTSSTNGIWVNWNGTVSQLGGGFTGWTTSIGNTAGAGTNSQGNNPLTAQYNTFTTVNATGGCTLPTPAAGSYCVIKNDGGTSALAVFPPSGCHIDGNNVNISFKLAPGATVSFYGIDATNWGTLGVVGYLKGAGSTVTQATSKVTGVTKNNIAVQITMNAANLAADTTASFVWTNNCIEANDIILINHVATGTFGAYVLNARAAAGSATIDVHNCTPGILGEAIVLRCLVIKCAIA
jgi:hypothetical protein